MQRGISRHRDSRASLETIDSSVRMWSSREYLASKPICSQAKVPGLVFESCFALAGRMSGVALPGGVMIARVMWRYQRRRAGEQSATS